MSLMEEGTCPVCIEAFSNPQILSCGHNLCLACALKLASPGETDDDNNNNSKSTSVPTKENVQDKKTTHSNESPLQTLFSLDAQKDPSSLAQKEKITCPICRKTTLVSELKANIALRNMVEIIKKEKSTEVSVVCDRCNKLGATLECQDCTKAGTYFQNRANN
eukprot:Phypoly_transcript_18129.p1 GENE.Phypoly_transcript_18129~~Phypoly_transcript_18129.p1  ORF type:complete len:163 (+),score=22.10 Phypoly_transcript_18129:34-522(+)